MYLYRHLSMLQRMCAPTAHVVMLEQIRFFLVKSQPRFAILIALYRPISGLSGQKWGKNIKKWILAPPGNWGKNGRKIDKGSKMVVFPFFVHFSPIFLVGPKSFFRPFFHMARNGVSTGQFRVASQDVSAVATLQRGLLSGPKL